MNIKNLVLSSVVAGAGILGLESANAAVTYGPVEQAYVNTTTTYVYVSPASFLAVPAYVYYCSTTDPELARAIVSSVHKNAYIGCSNAWPTTGTYRYGGTLSYIYVN